MRAQNFPCPIFVLGVLLVWVLSTTCAAWADEGPGASPVPAARTLVVCLDGVGYELVEEMHRRGELPHFQPPRPLITAFPSLTNLGLVEILSPLGAPPARGYEDYFFDPKRDRMSGGLLHRFSRQHFVESGYRQAFHYHPHPIRMTLEYALPVLGPWLNGTLTLARIRNEFERSQEPVFLAYFDSSDLAAHLNGKWMVRQFLRQLDRWAGELTRDPKRPVEVLLFSDHGNDYRDWRSARIEPALERAGFHLGGGLRDPRSVVLPQYGLVGSAVLYTRPGQESEVASALRKTEGVDLVVYREGDRLRVLSPPGEAWIERRRGTDGDWFRYRSDSGDPLQLEPLGARLQAEEKAALDGYIHEGVWLRATAEHLYPDPLRRLWLGFDGLVAQPASVLVSLADGYYTGSAWLDLVAFLRATHGNLRRAQTLGVLVSTSPQRFRGSAEEPGGPLPITGSHVLAQLGFPGGSRPRMGWPFPALPQPPPPHPEAVPEAPPVVASVAEHCL